MLSHLKMEAARVKETWLVLLHRRTYVFGILITRRRGAAKGKGGESARIVAENKAKREECRDEGARREEFFFVLIRNCKLPSLHSDLPNVRISSYPSVLPPPSPHASRSSSEKLSPSLTVKRATAYGKLHDQVRN